MKRLLILLDFVQLTLLRTAVLLALASLLPATAHSATLSIDVGKVYHAVKAMHDKTPATVKARRFTAALAGAATIADLVTTKRGNRRGLCELNPVLVGADGCRADPVRLGLAKGIMIAWLAVGEEVAHKLPHGAVWDKENTVLNIGAAVGFTVVSIKNESQ